ncbi:hypothetical protein [Flavobacterium sp. FlaQc-28]|uniref:hypothetical protein n=1 Tax=Flavobacterium sp. FlaQc-28 TaxID=3374178 RepID=UPI0037570438
MKKLLLLVVLLISMKNAAQNDAKCKFQKNKYELALSYLKNSDYPNALDQFSIASKLKPENEIGQESLKRIDTLKEILRSDILEKAYGTWVMTGDKPSWTIEAQNSFKNKTVDELVEINQNEILFFEQDRKSKVKKLLKKENLVYYNKDKSDALFSAIILSDGTIWSCSVDEKSKVLHVVNIGRQNENGFEKITDDNLEKYFSRM